MTTKNGYTRLPVVDPDTSGSTSYGGTASAPAPSSLSSTKRKKGSRTPTTLRPGLFYMFGSRGKYAANHVSVALADQSESEQERERIELTEIKPRKSKHRRTRMKSPKSPRTSRTRMNFNVIEEPILPDDTVQRVSLRYGVPASEIRRVNNLYRDQDFFALKTIKIPVREHSVLTEQKTREKCRKNNVEERTASGNNSSGAASDERRLGGPAAYYKSADEEEGTVSSSGDADDEVGDSDGPEFRGVSIQSALKWKHSRRALLEKFDEDLQRIRQSTEQQMSNVRQVAISMDMPAFHPIVAKEQTYESWLLGDWRHAVILVVVTVLVIAAVAIIIGLSFSNNSKQTPAT